MPRNQKQTDIDTEGGLPCEINSNIMMSGKQGFGVKKIEREREELLWFSSGGHRQ